MKLFLAGLLAVAACAAKQQGDPLAKVIEMTDDLTAKIKREGEEEMKWYGEFFEWCDDTAATARNEIKSLTTKKGDLTAELDKLSSDIEDATVKIDELAASLSKSTKELKAATKIRDKERATFEAEEAELVAGVDTLSRAIGIIEKGMEKAGGAAFPQVDTKNFKNVITALGTVLDAAAMDSLSKSKLMSFMQQRHEAEQSADEEDAELGAPAAAATEAKGGGILDVLEEMKDKAEEELDGLRAAETTAKNNYAMLKQSIEDSNAAENKEMADEKDGRSAAEEAKATAEGEMEVTVKALKQTTEELEVNNNNCMQTATDHENSMKSRAEELKVIAEAKKILLEATGGSALQTKKSSEDDDDADGDVSLLQVSSAQKQKLREIATHEVVAYVKKLAKQYKSRTLSMLASRVMAAVRFGRSGGLADPFAKIKGLIEDMISKLEKEAKEDAQEKAYCDEQMAKTGEKWQSLTDNIEKLTSKIDKAASASTELKAEVKELQEDLATLAKEQKEMDEIRKKEHTAYVKARDEQEKALTGVRKALELLRKYYGKSAAAMLQEGDISAAQMEQPKAPAMHSAAGGAGGGIISMLELCESDFAKALAAIEKEEADSESEYQSTTDENDKVKAEKTQDVKYKTQEFTGLDKSIADLSGDREVVNEELDAVNKYFSKIKDRCIAKPISYEEIQKRREAEIAGLKQALSILEGSFLQQNHRGKRSFRFRGADLKA